MRVQIVICSRNRSQLLDRALAKMHLLNVPDDIEVQLVIVDNGSTDNTQEVINNSAKQLNICSVVEPQTGHCFARNRALKELEGDLVLWTDDDVLVDPNWLVSYVDAARMQTDRSFWGGPIIPYFDQRRPAWLKHNWELCRACYAFRDLGDEPVDFHEQRLPYGANFAVRTAVQKQFEFDTSLGRRGDEVVGEDEIDMLRRIIGAGHQGRWVPNSKVRHVIEPERVSEKYVGAYFFGQGKMEALRNWRRVGSPGRLLYESITQRLLYHLRRPRASSNVWLTHLVRASLAKGKRVGLREAKAADS